jgi:outer membrane biosynthesis protein TonB
MADRGRIGLGTRAWALSTAFHVTLLVGAWFAGQYQPEPLTFITYEVDLVSPPPAVQAEVFEEAREELVVERPEPEPLPPEPEVEEVVPVEQPAEPEPEPEPTPPAPDPEPPPDTTEEPTVATAPEEPPEEEAELSGEAINVRIEGLRRDYPVYYDNIIQQIYRCFRWRGGGSWQTTVIFWIRRDGTATDIEFETRSGNSGFDFEAMGAVDCAGQGRFGPLPEELPYERLPIRFQFRPSGGVEVLFPDFGRPAVAASER